MQDDKKQCLRAESIIESARKEKESLHICLVVLCEVVWVLRYHYELEKDEVENFLELLLHAEQIEVKNREIALNAFNEYKNSKADFADCIIGYINLFQGCRTTFSFDAKATKLSTFSKMP